MPTKLFQIRCNEKTLKTTAVGDTFNKALAIVNFNRDNSTRHRQFRELLINDNETKTVDMPYCCQVRWLSRGNIFRKILNLKQKLVSFYEKKINNVIYRMLISLGILHFCVI